MTRTTRKDLDISMIRLDAAMRRGHLLNGSDRLALESGSKTNGVSYTLWILTEDGLRHSRPFPGTWLGYTAADCERSLIGLAAGIEATFA